MRRILGTVAFGSVLAAALLAPSKALANGRYPQAMQLVEDPSNANRLWLRTTYGMLTTTDRAAHWNWICEEALGFSSATVFDPMFGVLANGTVIMGLLDGLARGRSGGCAWDLPVPDTKNAFIQDIAIDPGNKTRGVGLLSQNSSEVPNYRNEIWETTNNGESFTLLANNFSKVQVLSTLDLANGDPDRIYVSGQYFDGGTFSSPIRPVLLRSKDRGKSWTTLYFSGLSTPLPAETVPYIAAVHPTNPDIVYVRTLRRIAMDAFGYQAESQLLYTENGGDTWKSVFSAPAPMLGFAISPDGSRIAIGLGDAGDNAYEIDDKDLGLFRSPAPNFKFDKVFDKSISCLNWTQRGLYVCSRLSQDVPFDLGLLTDKCPGFQPLQAQNQITGVLSCSAGTTVQNKCSAGQFQNQCSTLLLGCGDAGYPFPREAGAPKCEDSVSDAGIPDASVGGSGGAGGTTSSGGTSAGGTTSSGGSSAGSSAKPSDSDDDSCGCRTAGNTRSARDIGALMALGVAALGLARRRALPRA